MSTNQRTRIITLTGAKPAKIVDSQWPLIAQGSWGDVDSDDHPEGWLKVRRHSDGRMIVYGGYDPVYLDERALRGGELLAASDDVIGAIRRVGLTVQATAECIEDCLARLPPVEI